MAIQRPKAKGGGGGGGGKRKHDGKTYEFRVYTTTSAYAGDKILLITIVQTYQDVRTDGGRYIIQESEAAEQYARSIAIDGITIEDPEGTFRFYPPSCISLVEYSRLK